MKRENEQSDFKDPRTYGDGMMRTRSGIWVNLINPTVDMVHLIDISHALSHLCRFTGHTSSLISVALHSKAVAQRVPDEHKFAALLHDATEAYLGDMAWPLKQLLPDYQKLEEKWHHVIAEKFNFQYPFHESIKEADAKVLFKEWDAFLVGNMRVPYDHLAIMSSFEMDFRKLKDLPRPKYK